MPKGTAVAEVEAKLKRRYPGNPGAVYGTLNTIGLMHGSKPTKKGLKKATHLMHTAHSAATNTIIR